MILANPTGQRDYRRIISNGMAQNSKSLECYVEHAKQQKLENRKQRRPVKRNGDKHISSHLTK